eukprot:m.177910 g.177910  ORF g.177910 m.177910 type:complete len:679 (+) comp14442_c0_seq1:56-2092(+)
MAAAPEDIAADLELVNFAFIEDFRIKHKGATAELKSLEKRLAEYAQHFDQWDADKSGDLDLEELHVQLESSKGITQKELIELLTVVDDDNSGTIRYREFVNLMLIVEGVLKEPIEETEQNFAADPRRGSIFTRLRGGAKGGRGALVKDRNRNAMRKPKRGHIQIDCKVERGKLRLRIIRAAALLACDRNGKSDPYVKCAIEPDSSKESKQKTKIVKKTLDPEFNEEFEWLITPAERGKMLQIAVWDWDRLSKNDFIGSLSFPVQKIESGEIVSSGWFKLLDQDQGSKYAFPSNPDEIKLVTSHVHLPAMKGLVRKAPAGKRWSMSDFRLLKVLGQGSFGKVFLGEHKATKTSYAIKVLNKYRVHADDDVLATMSERRVLTLGGECPFLAHMVAGFQTDANLFFVMELITGGDLMFHVDERAPAAFKLSEVKFITAEVLFGLWYLHSKGIIYRDLKLDNVMLDSAGHIKLCDFGLVKEGLQHPPHATTTFCGTPDYIAPEIIDYLPYSYEVDFWSLGVMMYEMLTGEQPFDGESEEELFTSIKTQPIHLPRGMNKAASAIIKGIPKRSAGGDEFGIHMGFLVRSRKDRLQKEEDVKAHPFFKGFAWDDCKAKRMKPPLVPKASKKDPLTNFSDEFTGLPMNITPTDPKNLSQIPQDQFRGFTFVPGTVEEMVVEDGDMV